MLSKTAATCQVATNNHKFIAPIIPKTQRCSEDRELNQAKLKPKPVNQSVRTVRNLVHHHNGTQYCSTETVLFLQTNITSQMWPSAGKGWEGEANAVIKQRVYCTKVLTLVQVPVCLLRAAAENSSPKLTNWDSLSHRQPIWCLHMAPPGQLQ